MTTTPGTTAVALMMMTLLAAGPALSQTAGPSAPAAPVTDSTRRALASGASAARPLTTAALALVARTASQDAAAATPPDPGIRSAKECGSFVVLGTAIGAGAGAGAGFLLLASAGGSDSFGAILKGFAAIGAVLGSVGGLIACAD